MADTPLLYQMYTEMKLELDRRDMALHVLMVMSDDGAGLSNFRNGEDVLSLPPTKLLKAHKVN